MSDKSRLARRAFTLTAVKAILIAAAITFAGCGEADLGPSPPPGDKEGVVSNNHGHRAIVTAAQLNSSNTVTVDMRFRATHNHTLTLSPTDLGLIAENVQVIKTSSTDEGHNHTVTFN
jgi:hypothetical protein